MKKIQAPHANSARFIQQFEIQAQVIGKLEHPHIAPLYDYWREPGSAYLVMRWFSGGSLDDLLSNRALNVGEVIRLADHVGQALTAAHRANVLHLSIQPSNVLLDGDGNFYLTDFEMVDTADQDHHGRAGGRFRSPEQLAAEPIGVAADIYGLGRLVEFSLRPRSAMTQAAVIDAVAKATRVRPADRFGTMADFVHELKRELSGSPPPSAGENRSRPDHPADPPPPLVNPYKGLRTFQEADAGEFHGREQAVAEVVERLGGEQEDPVARRMVAVVGPSGSGKSSLARAGLLPALRRDQRFPGATYVATMVPGASPFDELADALRSIADRDQDDLAQQLRSGRLGLVAMMDRLLPAGDNRLILLIDQFEELFTLVYDEEVRDEFLEMIVAAVTTQPSPVVIIITLRADFWGHPLRYPVFGRILEEAAVHLVSMGADELARAIERPAVDARCRLEPSLVAQITADVVNQPGALPSLQFALTELFEQRDGCLLTLASYRRIGGLIGALSARADDLADSLSRDGIDSVRDVFSRLVTLGEGVADTRRRVLRSELQELPGVDGVLDGFGRARLLTFDHDPATREPTVEIAHEALLGGWRLLRSWIDEDREGIRLHRQLTEACCIGDVATLDEEDLYHGARLDATLDWRRRRQPKLTEAEEAFLTASAEARQRRHQAEQRQMTRLRRAFVSVAVLLAVAVITGAAAFVQRQRAVDATATAVDAQYQAETRRLISDVSPTVESSRELGLLLAAEAYRR